MTSPIELIALGADPDDPAISTVRAFLAAHPTLDARLVFTNANVRVSPNYLNGIVAALLQPGVGLVSNVVAGTGERTRGAAL